MRKLSIFLPGLLLLVACNNSNTSANIETKPDSAKKMTSYAYTPKDMPNWEIGNPELVPIALNALKSYETGKMDELNGLFADSVWFGDEGIEFNGTKDSLLRMFKNDRANLTSLSVEMQDWEVVHGKDNKEDWVGLWYKAKWTGKDGKTDSASFMDDLKFENGKIRVIDSKRRNYPTKK